MNNVNNIKTRVHNALLSFRALYRLVNSPRFEQALNLDPENVRIQFALISGNFEAINEWVQATLGKELGNLTMAQLRIKAASRHILYYTTKTKDQLIQEILDYDRKAAKTSG